MANPLNAVPPCLCFGMETAKSSSFSDRILNTTTNNSLFLINQCAFLSYTFVSLMHAIIHITSYIQPLSPLDCLVFDSIVFLFFVFKHVSSIHLLHAENEIQLYFEGERVTMVLTTIKKKRSDER
eukprot:627419_1